MKTHYGKFLSLVAILSTSFFLSGAQGQTAKTNPVGFVTLNIQPGYNAIGPTLVNSPVFQGLVASSAGSAITLSTTGGSINLATTLQAGIQYYVEVAQPNGAVATYLGDFLEVDVATTRAAANNVISMQVASYNTLSSPLPNLTGYSVIIRPHVTLGQAFGTLGNILLKGAGSSGSADQVQFYDRTTGGFQTYWFRSNVAGTIAEWRSLNGADTTNYSNLAIPPGVGVFVLRQLANPALNITFVGSVRTNDLRQPLVQGYNLVAQGLPSGHSPASLGMNIAGGFVGAGSAASADQILFLDPTTGSYSTYWFRANVAGTTQQWRSLNAADTTDYMNTTSFFDGTKAVFIVKTAADGDRFLPITALNLGN